MSNTTVPYTHPSVWRGPDLAARKDWILLLDDDDVADIENALSTAKNAGLSIPALAREGFQLTRVGEKMARVRYALEEGLGFALIRGLPVGR